MSRRPTPANLDAWRHAIAEAACRARVYADMADQYAAISDDAGLDYSIRCLIASTRHAASLLADLKSEKELLRTPEVAA